MFVFLRTRKRKEVGPLGLIQKAKKKRKAKNKKTEGRSGRPNLTIRLKIQQGKLPPIIYVERHRNFQQFSTLRDLDVMTILYCFPENKC